MIGSTAVLILTKAQNDLSLHTSDEQLGMVLADNVSLPWRDI